MNHQPLDPHETETSVRDIDLRHRELAAQYWDHARSKALAEAEVIAFSDQHWEVIVFLHNYYLEHGLPINARTTATALNSHFYQAGGSEYPRLSLAKSSSVVDLNVINTFSYARVESRAAVSWYAPIRSSVTISRPPMSHFLPLMTSPGHGIPR